MTESNLVVEYPNENGAENFQTYENKFGERFPQADKELERLDKEEGLYVVLEDKESVDEQVPCSNCGSDVSNQIFAYMDFQDREHRAKPVLCTDCLEKIHTEDVEPVRLTEETIQEYE